MDPAMELLKIIHEKKLSLFEAAKLIGIAPQTLDRYLIGCKYTFKTEEKIEKFIEQNI